MAQLFLELAVVMVVAMVISLVMNKLKQPLLVGYILTGVMAGPIFFNLLTDPGTYEAFAHIGVSFLLFIVGMQLNLSLIKEVGAISIVTGVGQIVFTTIIGILINLFLGFSWIPSVLIALALTFSSTIIIIKLLSDTQGLEKLHGRISLGFLLIQDLVAVLLLMIVGTFATGAGSIVQILWILGMGIVALLGVFLSGKYVLPPLLNYIVHHRELFFLFIIAWCFGVSATFQYIGFSIEIGALVAGIVLASTEFRQELESRIKPLRDFFIILFFIFLGTQLIPQPEVAIASGEQLQYIVATLGPIVPQALILSLFVLIGNPFIVLILVTKFSYSARTGFLAGLTVSQISEFSIILVLLAQEAGFLTVADVSLITLVAIITITCSTYVVIFGERIYDKLHPLLRKLEKKKVKDSLQGIQGQKHDVGIFGYRRIGPHALKAIKKAGYSYLIVDHDPSIVSSLRKKNEPVLFGDVESAEFLSEFDFKHMGILISTIPHMEISVRLLDNYRAQHKKGLIVLTASHNDDALLLYEKGADYVIIPQHLGGKHIETLIHEFSYDQERFFSERINFLKEIQAHRS